MANIGGIAAKLDVLITNARIAFDRGQPLSELSMDVLRKTFETNLLAVKALWFGKNKER